MACFPTLRYILVAVLLSLFLWQTYQAARKFLAGGLTINVEMAYPETTAFPAVTLCPVALYGDNRQEEANETDGDFFTFAELPRGYIYGYEHDFIDL